jgi:S1-C subfamily serine protease
MVQRLGIFCMELSGDTAELFPGLRRHYGLVVAAKSSDGLASSIDLKPGDVIHSINNLPIASLDLFRERIDALKRGDAVALQVEREGRFQYVAFDIE